MSLSVIIPVYNEAENLPLLQQALHQALDPLGRPWEVLYVDDGSRDGSAAVLEELAAADPAHVRVILFRRNFGQTAAIAAGLDYAAGELLVMMDADMQNDPADIGMMLAKLDEGYDVVSGWRINRQDTFATRKLPSQLANGLIARITGVHLHDYGCALKIYRREVLEDVRLYGEMHRFVPAYAAWQGARIVEVPVNHHPRRFGQSKYGLKRTFKVLMDLWTVKMLTTFAHKPMYLFGGLGYGLLATGALLLALSHWWSSSPLAASLITSLLFIAIGLQCFQFGLLAELLMRTYHEAQGKTPYAIRRTINIKEREVVKTPGI